MTAVPHIGREALARFVVGCSSCEENRFIETHVRGCVSCAASLADEARFEVELQAAWPQVNRPSAVVLTLPVHRPVVAARRGGRFSRFVATAGGAAAAALFALVGTNGVTPRLANDRFADDRFANDRFANDTGSPVAAADGAAMSPAAPLSASWASWGGVPHADGRGAVLMNADVFGRLAMADQSAVDGEGACVGSALAGSHGGFFTAICGVSGWGGRCRPVPAAACAEPTP